MNTHTLDRFRAILKKPMFSEKGHHDQEKKNAYHFQVAPDANKVEIRRAVEALFKVKVVAVNTVVRPSKVLRRGSLTIEVSSFKKAIVTLKAGQSIEYA
ncbi:MAG: 50S ribosomal protein L23 [Planctomycetes bacterium]|nr:50S ribosomal protein L23 [Planctomycetota bacterium]